MFFLFPLNLHYQRKKMFNSMTKISIESRKRWGKQCTATKSIRRALMMSERLEAGTVWVNTYRAVSYMSPFGGYKRSGIGRESGIDAIREYLETKSVWISTAKGAPANPFILR